MTEKRLYLCLLSGQGGGGWASLSANTVGAKAYCMGPRQQIWVQPYGDEVREVSRLQSSHLPAIRGDTAMGQLFHL